MSITEIRFLSTNWKGPHFPSVRVSGDLPPFRPSFSPQVHPLVLQMSNILLLGIIFRFESLPFGTFCVTLKSNHSLQGHFCENLILRLGLKFTPRIPQFWWKFPVDPLTLLPVLGRGALSWLLGSSHNLLIERGRHSRPINLRGERVYKFC